ncbi:MAG: hypothetical protein ICV62_04995 [Cyanobacteria bacterium Co-bin13]|nr:hypothetical protein [Cyanobacteria bacterium Co-bin13]
MKPSTRRKRPVPGWKRFLDRANATPTPWLWLTATLLLYGSAGLILAAFPVPYWIWTVALAGILLQSVALVGPKALQRLRRVTSRLMTLLGIVGAAALAFALSAALNFLGTPDLEGMELQGAALEVMMLSLAALLLAGLCAVVTARTGDRLIAPFRRAQACLILAATAVLGLGIGGAVGLLATRF